MQGAGLSSTHTKALATHLQLIHQCGHLLIFSPQHLELLHMLRQLHVLGLAETWNAGAAEQ